MKVILSRKAHLKMTYYIEEIDYEISGLGSVVKKGNDLYVEDIFLFEQKVSAAQTTLDTGDVDKFFDEMMKRECVDEEAREKLFDDVGNIKLWWHSHNDMAVFWSKTDTDTQESLDLDHDVDNWWLSIVGNNAGDRKAKLDIYRPHRVWMDDLEIVIEEDPEYFKLRQTIKEEIKEKVTEPVYVVPKPVNIYNKAQKNWGKGKKKGKNTKTGAVPLTTDMQNMVDNMEQSGWHLQDGILVPNGTKKLKRSNNRKLN